MSFTRPEARAVIWRWREALTGTCAVALGLYWVLVPGGLLHWVGYTVVAAGLLLAFAGLQRGRFRTGAGGVGVVQIDEGRISYFGPLSGGSVALSEMSMLSYDSSARPPHWILHQPREADLYVPVNAEGADTLFDVSASLPGLRLERVLAARRDTTGTKSLLWQRPPSTTKS